MPRTKKPIDKDFHRAATNALGARNPYTVARGAGLCHQSIARVLAGTDPGLSRAIEIARVLGFEICYRLPHNNSVDHRAASLAKRGLLPLAATNLRESPHIEDFLDDFISLYATFTHLLGPVINADPTTISAVIELVEESAAKPNRCT